MSFTSYIDIYTLEIETAAFYGPKIHSVHALALHLVNKTAQ